MRILLCTLYSNKKFCDRLYGVVLPTKIERNMWYYSIKNLKRDFNKVDFDELGEVRLKMFQIDYKIGNKTTVSFEIPIPNEKVYSIQDLCYISIKSISKYVAKAQLDNQQRSRRSTIDFNELSDLSDDNDSHTQDADHIQTVDDHQLDARPGYFDQPIPSYNDDREQESLRLSSQDNSDDVSGIIKGDKDWNLDISKIKYNN